MGELFVRRRVLRALVLLCVFLASGVHADDRQDYLIRVLRSSSAFRVRAQAAVSLGRLDPTNRSISALERAADDKHPAVRVAAISSLGRLDAKQSLPTVEIAKRDRNPAVRRAATDAVASLESVGERMRGPGKARHLVAVGMPGATAERVSRQMLFDARIFVSEQLVRLEGVELAPENLSAVDAKRELQRRGLSGHYLETSVVKLQPSGNAVRAEVSVIVLSYPGRNMRAMLRGAAAASGRFDASTAEQAIQGAYVGALRRLPQVLSAVDAGGGF